MAGSNDDDDSHVTVLAACGLFSLLCYVAIISRAMWARIQIANRADEVGLDGNTDDEASRSTYTSIAWYFCLKSMNRTIEILANNLRVVRNRLEQTPDSPSSKLWQAHVMRRIHISVEVTLHICAFFLLLYAILLVLGQPEWFSFLLFKVGSGGNGQLDLLGLAFCFCFVFWIWPEMVTFRTANTMHAVLVGALFMVIRSEHRMEIHSFTVASVLRVACAFVFCSLPWTMLFNLTFAVFRVCDDVRIGKGSSVTTMYVDFFKIELMTLACVCAAVYIAECQIHEAVRFLVDSRIARSSESATKHLLSQLCDAAFYLGPDLRLQKHSPELASLLLREGARSLEGCEFEELVQFRDRDRFSSYIKEAVQGPHSLPSIDEMSSFESRSTPLGDRWNFRGARSRTESTEKKEGPLIIHLNAASSTTVCVEMYHIVSKDIDERLTHLIGIREFQGNSVRNSSIIHDLPPPEHLLFPLRTSSAQCKEGAHLQVSLSIEQVASDTPSVRNMSSFQQDALLRGGSGLPLVPETESRLSIGGSSSGDVSSISGSSSGVGSIDWIGICDDTDGRIQIETVDLQDDDGVDLIALWFDAASTNLALLKTTTGFAKLGRPFRVGDTLPGLLANDPNKLITKIKRYVADSKQDYTLYTDEGPEPFNLGKLRFRLGYTLSEVSAECIVELKPQDEDSDEEESSKVLEGRILLTSLKHSKATREKKRDKD